MTDRPTADQTGRTCEKCVEEGYHGPISSLSDYGDIGAPRCWIHAIHDTPIWKRYSEEAE